MRIPIRMRLSGEEKISLLYEGRPGLAIGKPQGSAAGVSRGGAQT